MDRNKALIVISNIIVLLLAFVALGVQKGLDINPKSAETSFIMAVFFALAGGFYFALYRISKNASGKLGFVTDKTRKGFLVTIIVSVLAVAMCLIIAVR